MGFAATEIILLITFGLIYGIFLVYDLFKRGDNYGTLAYIFALLPGNYLWYIVTKNAMYDFGATGASMVLVCLWLFAVFRDILIKDKSEGYKDADDVVLVLIIALILNFILSAVLPAFTSLNFMANGTKEFWTWFRIPETFHIFTYSPSAAIILVYKIMCTVLTLTVIIPLIIDLKETPVNIVALIIITIIFAVPFGFLAYLWAGNSTPMIPVLLFLFSVIFFIFLLLITKGQKEN
ncbi:hypothetical protein NEF87_000130 [Candidatus Lokiarchaeum ossiferum]|uniref:Uncharacterized protein n=1 Tax=Candidatus Lokiarchaeum ossiferum TaxID=2951803 RepID=A0ABY6HJZ0_9ARCH|nr:hypothetical protein NEF87_000130 [Candidatus Lokiarchaeum sp. B-35]